MNVKKRLLDFGLENDPGKTWWFSKNCG